MKHHASIHRQPLAVILFVLALVLLAQPARADLGLISPADIEADIDWPMYIDPELKPIVLVQAFDARMKGIWSASLARPDVETRRRAAYEIGLAAGLGMPGLNDLVPQLIAMMDAPDAHPVFVLAAATALIQLDAKQAAPNLLAINERGAASGVIRGDTVGKDGKGGAGNAGIEFTLITDPALAKWNSDAAKAVWMKRLEGAKTPRPVLVSAITQLAAVKHKPAADALWALAFEPRGNDGSLRLLAAQSLAAIVDDGREPPLDAATAASLPLIDRLVTVTVLSSRKSDSAKAALTALAMDKEPAVARIALRQLAQLDENIVSSAQATVLIKSPDAEIRRYGAQAIAARKSPAAVAELGPLLNDISPIVRAFVRERFIAFDKAAELSVPVREQAVKMLGQTSWRGIEAAAVVLGRLDHEPAAARLIELLPHKRNEVRIAAIVALRRLEIKEESMLAAITAHLNREADDWLKTIAFAKQQTHLPFIVDGQRDRQMAQLLQLLGLARYKPAGPVMERYVPKMSGFWTEARSAGVWALGLLHEDKPDERLAAEFAGRLSDLDPNNPEMTGVRRMGAVSIGRMKAASQLRAVEVFYESEKLSQHIGGSCRWAIMRITGKELPPLPSREVSETGWFIQPLSAPK